MINSTSIYDVKEEIIKFLSEDITNDSFSYRLIINPDCSEDSIIPGYNELYLEISNKKIFNICAYANNNLKYPLILMFANDERCIAGNYAIYYIFADRINEFLLTIKTYIQPDNPTFISISGKIPAAYGYECEIYNLYGIKPMNHPHLNQMVFHGNWPHNEFPLRKDFNKRYKPPFVKNDVEFIKVEGEGVYEIPVGPVHAGIIEPGHFRFSVAGEPIINLQAQLYYVHRGIEKMCEDESIEKCYYFAERISGDESFSNSLAYCQAIERVVNVDIPKRAKLSRVIFAELERLTSHLGDLGGICLDVAYGFAASQFRMMRGWTYQIADELCGARFLRSVNRPGGIRKDFINGKEKKVIEWLEKIKVELLDTVKIIKANSMFIDRVENTGVLDKSAAIDLNAVGPAGRAAGIEYDVRRNFPYAAYKELCFDVSLHNNGDVNCRMNVKIEECFASIKLILEAIEGLKPGEIWVPIPDVKPYKCAFGITESPKGENIHWIMTGENNTIFRYKIRTPSFCNWPALCHAVKGNILPDFPLINKSFNLSYAGNDL